MTLLEAISLAVAHHPNPSRQLKWYYKHKIIFAGMRGDIKTNGDGYDETSLRQWLRPKQVSVYLDTDVNAMLYGKGKEEVSQIVNEAVRTILSK